ncbi:MAG TPA: glycosyltransferase N-terminal domain-containing protein [Oligoflexia bacterium]|nr:glycosyltransferase N-terminal domain-containing protein [Oligoflexia bacterium]
MSLRFHANTPIEYWIHVASAGELEYAMPILNELNLIGKKVLVTYYSVSAQIPVEALPARLPCVALTVPLPHDGLGLMGEFVKLVRKQGVHTLLLLKYEMWPGLLWECNAHGVRVILAEALKPSWFHRKLIHKLSALLAGYETELEGVDHPHRFVVGDTRVERVNERLGSEEPLLVKKLRDILGTRRAVVCGSMWPEDHEVLTNGLKKIVETKTVGSSNSLPDLIWLPHELDRKFPQKAESDLKQIGYDTLWVEKDADLTQVRLSDRPAAFIVFKKGVLVELYKLGRCAFVGGGFVSNVHNVWEPALAGCRVACGPEISRAPEASQLSSEGLLKVLTDASSMSLWLKQAVCTNESGRQDEEVRTRESLARVVETHRGAARRIVDYCEGQ